MNGFLTITSREIQTRRMVLVAAFVAGLIPFLAPFIPGTSGSNPAEIRGAFALILAIAFGLGTSVMCGSTVLVRDLMEQRLGFYFARPVPVVSIWGGKLLAAILLSLSTIFLTATPVLLVDHGFGSMFRFPIQLPILVVALLILLVLSLHALGSIVRSHSRWLIADLCAALLLGITFWWAGKSLLFSGYWGWDASGLNRAPVWVVSGLAAALLVAIYSQLSSGRTDPLRGHRALSLTFWGIVGAAAITLSSLALWVTAATPASLILERTRIAPEGEWVFVSGPLRHRGEARGAFLFNSTTGSWVRVPWRVSEVEFSGDGLHAAWLERDSLYDHAKAELVSVDLSKPEPKPVHSTIQFSSSARFVLSPTGQRVATIDDDLLSIYELSSGKQLAGARIPSTAKNASPALYFVGEDHLRILRNFTSPKSTPWPFLLDFDVATKQLAESGRLLPEFPARMFSIHPTSRGDQMLVVDGDRLSLRDGRTGELISILSNGMRVHSGTLLEGGGVATLLSDGEGDQRRVSLATFSARGEPVRMIPLGPARVSRSVGQLPDGRFLVALGPLNFSETGWQSQLSLIAVDLTNGTLSPIAKGLLPLNFHDWWLRPLLEPWASGKGSLETKLFVDQQQTLVRFDPKEGTKTLLGGTH